MLNCKTSCENIRFRDADRLAIDLEEQGDRALSILEDWACRAKLMRPCCKRKNSLTSDTANAVQWTCQGLIALSNFLLMESQKERHEYVLLGFYQQDDIEHHFGHFRQSAGCNYYLTAKEVFNTHSLDITKFVLRNDIFDDSSDSYHKCNLCDLAPTSEEARLLDDMAEKDMCINRRNTISRPHRWIHVTSP